MLGAVVSVMLSGFLIGSLGRFALPGPDPMPFWLTVLVGMSGSVVGGGIAAGILGPSHTFDTSGHAFVTLLLEVAAAVGIVAVYRRVVQRRPLSGPGAYRFPTRGVGIERLRARLRRLGVDPDRVRTGPDDAPPAEAELTPEEVAEKLASLREKRDSGTLSEEEYERARERLRRY